MTEIPSTKADGSVVGDEYVATAKTRLRSGAVIGQADLKVPAAAVDSTVVGRDAVERLKQGLEMAVQALAQYNAKASGKWPT